MKKNAANTNGFQPALAQNAMFSVVFCTSSQKTSYFQCFLQVRSKSTTIYTIFYMSRTITKAMSLIDKKKRSKKDQIRSTSDKQSEKSRSQARFNFQERTEISKLTETVSLAISHYFCDLCEGWPRRAKATAPSGSCTCTRRRIHGEAVAKIMGLGRQLSPDERLPSSLATLAVEPPLSLVRLVGPP